MKRRTRHQGKGMLVFSWGRYGGFYWYRGFGTRLCLGWLAITYMPVELEWLMRKAVSYGYLGNEEIEHGVL